jgi:hypothetical protein
MKKTVFVPLGTKCKNVFAVKKHVLLKNKEDQA